MATFKHIDETNLQELLTQVFTALEGSPLNENTTYTLEASADGKSLILKDDNGVSVTTLTGVLFTSADATKLSGIAAGAQVNVIEGVIFNGTELTPDANKKITITTPASVQLQWVATLPATGEEDIIYLVPNGGTGQNQTDEYVWDATNSRFEKVGTLDVDLSEYVKNSDIVALTQAEITTAVEAAYQAVFGS